MTHEEEVTRRDLIETQIKEGVRLIKQIIGVEKSISFKGMKLDEQREGLVKRFATLVQLMPDKEQSQMIELLSLKRMEAGLK